MATNTYTVVKGDTLSGIAAKYKSSYGFSDTYAYVNELVKINDISNPNYIVVGQVIKLSGTAATVKKNTTSKPTIKVFGLQSNTDRTVYATWSWDKSNTENYEVKWYYTTGDGVRFIGSETTVTSKQATYTAPANAKKVVFKVKPVSKKRKVNGKETTYWTASWSTEKIYDFSNNPPSVPPVPTVTIDDKLQLTASLDNLDVNASIIQFQVVKDNATVVKTAKIAIKTTSASYTCTVAAGGEYKVRCRAYRDNMYSDWSNYSSGAGTVPSTPSKLTKCQASSETSVVLEWTAISNATNYDIEYATNKSYFEGSDQTTIISDVGNTTHYEKTGLTSGDTYFFRIRAKNDKGTSGWSEISSTAIGTLSISPTTWSSTTTVIVGEQLTLYWVHNSEDGSKQTYAELELIVDGVKESHIIENPNADDKDAKETTSSYVIDTSQYSEGVQIKWRVRTAGVKTDTDGSKLLGDWSIQRTVDVYARPTLELSVTNSEGNSIDTLELFPMHISASAGPSTQTPVGYHISIVANSAYETMDNMGNEIMISEGDEVYSQHFDVTSNPLETDISASNVNLENNASYTIKCTVSMNSGLTAEATYEFDVAWIDMEYEPNAEIAVDEDAYSAIIRPYCEDADGELIEDVTLAVYRREFDGSFTELASDIKNSSNAFITDPHPALDYARYRVVATSKTTGGISYCDIPGYPIGGKAVIIQWDEKWTSFETSNEDVLEQPSWSGSLLKLPYNIDVSDKRKSDVALVEYIGRKHPVSYHGTQLGETSTWNLEIPKDDKETLYGLRRLSVWMGNVYVREPSGSGYWASISVSFSQKHCEVTIPVTIEITRVEGGA